MLCDRIIGLFVPCYAGYLHVAPHEHIHMHQLPHVYTLVIPPCLPTVLSLSLLPSVWVELLQLSSAAGRTSDSLETSLLGCQMVLQETGSCGPPGTWQRTRQRYRVAHMYSPSALHIEICSHMMYNIPRPNLWYLVQESLLFPPIGQVQQEY